jgi:hypothetical protein
MAETPLINPRPLDRCTFRRPFAHNFRECPAFEAVEFGVMDLRGNKLAAIITCSHLFAEQLRTSGSAYARCMLGGPAERAAYAAGHL